MAAVAVATAAVVLVVAVIAGLRFMASGFGTFVRAARGAVGTGVRVPACTFFLAAPVAPVALCACEWVGCTNVEGGEWLLCLVLVGSDAAGAADAVNAGASSVVAAPCQ